MIEIETFCVDPLRATSNFIFFGVSCPGNQQIESVINRVINFSYFHLPCCTKPKCPFISALVWCLITLLMLFQLIQLIKNSNPAASPQLDSWIDWKLASEYSIVKKCLALERQMGRVDFCTYMLGLIRPTFLTQSQLTLKWATTGLISEENKLWTQMSCGWNYQQSKSEIREGWMRC